MPGPGEVAWTEDDVEYALAWQALASDDCPGCGQPRSESFADDNHDAYTVRKLRCHACAARDSESKDYAESGGEMGGLYLAVTKTRGGGDGDR
jgi:hypothetical protein